MRLQGRRADWTRISSETEIDRSTIQRIANGETPSPRIDTAETLSSWLTENPPEQENKRGHEAAA